MTGAAILLVVLSAFAHSGWNYLTKRANRPELFTWWAALAENTILLPVVLYFLIAYPPDPVGWAFVGATWALHLGYFTFLSRAYRDSDLSLVYPVARGTGVVLAPALGVAVLGERMAPAAIAGATLIVLGLFVVSVGGAATRSFKNMLAVFKQPGIRYALATGLIIGGYSIVDKRGVSHVHPVIYMYCLTTAATLGMPYFLRRRYSGSEFAAEWRRNARTIVVSGLLQFTAYVLVLSALQLSRVSYVAPFRETGIVIGVLLGALLLNEPFKRRRLQGAALIVAGAILIAVFP